MRKSAHLPQQIIPYIWIEKSNWVEPAFVWVYSGDISRDLPSPSTYEEDTHFSTSLDSHTLILYNHLKAQQLHLFILFYCHSDTYYLSLMLSTITQSHTYLVQSANLVLQNVKDLEHKHPRHMCCCIWGFYVVENLIFGVIMFSPRC